MHFGAILLDPKCYTIDRLIVSIILLKHELTNGIRSHHIHTITFFIVTIQSVYLFFVRCSTYLWHCWYSILALRSVIFYYTITRTSVWLDVVGGTESWNVLCAQCDLYLQFIQPYINTIRHTYYRKKSPWLWKINIYKITLYSNRFFFTVHGFFKIGLKYEYP